MKRVIYEWCGLAFAGLAIACGVAWAVSLVNSSATLELSFGNRIQMVAAGGSVTFCDHAGSRELIELANSSPIYFNAFLPPATAVHLWSIPGFQVGVLGFEERDARWSLHFSLLLPFGVFLALGGFCMHRYRHAWRQKPAGPRPVAEPGGQA